MSLGLEDGRIPDSALTASTVHSAACAAKFARLNLAAASGRVGSWCAKANDSTSGYRLILELPQPLPR